MQRKTPARSHLFLSVLAGLVGLTGGCFSRPPAPAPPNRPFAGKVLRIATPRAPSGPAFAAFTPTGLVERQATSWGRSKGCRVEVAAYDPATGPETVAADVWIVRPAELPRWAAAGKLHPVPQSLTEAKDSFAWWGLLPDYRDKLLRWDETAYGLPLLGEAPLCFYRTDLFSEHAKGYREETGRELAPPATWEEFAAIAEFFHKKRVLGGHSLPPLPAEDEDLDAEFWYVAVPFVRRALTEEQARASEAVPSGRRFSFHYDVETGRPLLQGNGFVHALRLLEQLQNCRPVKPAESSEPPAQHFRQGRAVFCLADASWIAPFQDRKSPIRGKFGFARLPGAGQVFAGGDRPEPVPDGNFVPYLGAFGWVAVVPLAGREHDAAFALLAELSGPEGSKRVRDPHWGGGVFRTSHFEPVEAWNGFDLDPAATRHLVHVLGQTLSHPGLLNPVLRLRTPDERPHRDALVAELRRVLLERREPSDALAAAARRWSEIDGMQDIRRRLDNYRRSLSLGAARQ